VHEVNSYKLLVENNVVDYIEKEVEDQYKVIVTPVVEMDNFDDDVDEYQNRNKIMVHDYFVVVDMNVDKMMMVILNLLFDHLIV
jgi:hypothetical protein